MASSAAVKTLLRALAIVPSEAIPNTVDAFLLATSTPHTQLLSSLVDEISQLMKELSTSDHVIGANNDLIIALLLTIFHLFKLADNCQLLLPSVVWGVYVPLLQKSSVFTAAFQNTVSQMLVEILISKNAWKYAQDSLLPYLLSTVELIVVREQGSFQLGAAQTEKISSSDFADKGSQKPLKFDIVCGVVAMLLANISNDMDTKPSKEGGSSEISRDTFCIELILRFFKPLLSLISQTGSDMERQSVIKVFLPPILRIIDKFKEDMLREFVEPLQKELWNHLKLLFTRGCLQKQDAFAALDISVKFLLVSFTKEQSFSGKQLQVFDLCNEMEFWDVVKFGLVDEDSLTRKRALHILKEVSKAGPLCQNSATQGMMDWKGLNNKSSSPLTKRDKYAALEARSLGLWDYQMELWKAFFLLYDMLEEYGTHLVEAAWNHQISLLLPMLCGSNMKIEVSNEPQFKCMYHLQNLDVSVWWITVLWEKGLKHDNPQVRRLILQSFMKLEWTKVANIVEVVPKEFVLGPLLSAVNDPIHHKDFGAKGFYTSEMAKAAATFYSFYSKSLEIDDRMDFVIKMAEELHMRSLCRPGFMTLVMCLEASASPHHFCALDGNDFSTCANTMLRDPAGDDAHADNSGIQILDILGLLVEESKNHFNPRYRLKVCYHVLRAAVSTVVLHELPFTKFFWFLSIFPQDFVNFKGLLHKHVWEWLTSTSNMSLSPLSFNSQTWMTKGLHDIADSFVKPSKCGTDVVTDGEVEAWMQEADKWARVISLGFLEPKNLSSLMMCVHDHACQIYQRAYNSMCVPEKLLILLRSIIKICSTWLEDCMEHNLCKGIPEGMERKQKFVPPPFDGSCSLEIMRSHLQSIITINMGEFLAHAQRVASVFWSFDLFCGGALPSSVIGQLGGPSQRRLPAIITSAVLKGVIAISTFADSISWCCENMGGEISESAVIFVWEFAWKAVKLREAKEEIEAEIQLGMYEALVALFKALALSVNPHVLSIVNQAVIFGGAQDGKAMDTLVWNLLEHVNHLLHGRILARGRQAVLLLQKWCCMDSLLSVPMKRVICIDTSQQNDTPALSDSILKTVLLDGISSLESASEDNLLPLLRCVRWLMHWDILQRLDTTDSSNESKKGLEIVWSLVRSAWAAVADSNKRRVASIAAFLSAIVHPKTFKELSMHYNNGDAGPLKWIIGKLLDQGSRSPRTMRLTAMHVAGLWFKYPAVTEYYIEEFKMLSLHGGESIDEELDGQISENPLAAREYLTLMQSLDPELIEEFRNSELYVRVTMAVLVHKLAETAEGGCLSGESDTKLVITSAANCGKKFIKYILSLLAHDKELSKELYKKKSAIHRRKTRAWQMTCILSQFVDKDMVVEIMDLLQLCLSKNNLPSVRQYAEIFGIQICLKYPYLLKERIVPALSDYNMKTQALASYVFISVNVLKHAAPASLQKELIEEILPAVMPYFTTHHHPLRSFTQILMYEVLHKILKYPAHWINHKGNLEKNCLQSIVSYLDENIECKRIRVAVEKFMSSFDPSMAATPRGIFSVHKGGEEDPSKPLDDIPFECAPIALMDEVSYFLNDAREDLRQSMTADAILLQSEEMYEKIKREEIDSQPRTSQDGPLDFQRKIASLRFSETPSTESKPKTPENRALIEKFSMLSVIEKEEKLLQTTMHTRIEDLIKMRGNRQELIVVATLLGRIPNLAGLVRTCEVFKASSLILADASIVQDRQFQLISVTAEMWVPIKEIPESSLQDFLEVKMKEGFTLVGLEQTAHSVSLEKYTFPKKTVLVLGKEKEGIPINIIQILDACVEIPQLGVIRSLNVHVSGAIAIWEYTRQFLGK